VRISITTKLILFVLILSLISTFVVGKYSFEKAKTALVERTFDQLVSLRIEKTNRIQNLFLHCQNDISNISRSDDTRDIFQLMNSRINDGNKDITSEKALAIYDRYLKGYLEASNYFDKIILLSPPNVLVINVKKNKESYIIGDSVNDFLTEFDPENLTNDEIVIKDIENFGTNTTPVIAFAFNTNPSSDSVKHTLILEMPIKVINDIMLENSANNSLGKTGETYLVGSDFLMRSTSRFQDNSVFKTKVFTEGVKEAFRNKTGNRKILDYRDVPVLSSFGKVNIAGLNWVILSEIDVEEAMIPIDSIKDNIIYLTFIIFLLLLGVVALLTSMITAPIRSLISKTDKVSEGEFGQTLNYKANDEVGDLVKAFNKMTLQLKSQSEKLEKERLLRLTSLIDGQELERRRLSKELHDGLGQLILASKLKFQRALDEKPEKAKQIIKETEDLFRRTMLEVRNISNGLMPAVLTEFGLLTAIRNLAKEITESSGINVIVHTSIQSLNLSAKIETYIYRIVQEALNNVIKHADANEVVLILTEKNNKLNLSIKDNGKGMITNNYSTGNGLNNMKDRATLLSGELQVISELGSGTEIRLVVQNSFDE